MRNQLLSEKEFIFDAQSVIEGAIEDFIASHPNMDSFVLERYIFDHISYSLRELILILICKIKRLLNNYCLIWRWESCSAKRIDSPAV